MIEKKGSGPSKLYFERMTVRGETLCFWTVRDREGRLLDSSRFNYLDYDRAVDNALAILGRDISDEKQYTIEGPLALRQLVISKCQMKFGSVVKKV